MRPPLVTDLSRSHQDQFLSHPHVLVPNILNEVTYSYWRFTYNDIPHWSWPSVTAEVIYSN